MTVVDASGREWIVERRFAPWRRVVQPVALARGRYRSRSMGPRPSSRWEKAFRFMGTEPFMAPDIYPMLITVFLAITVVLPLVVLETVAQLVAGTVLAVPRALGLARHRVDVLEHIGRHLYFGHRPSRPGPPAGPSARRSRPRRAAGRHGAVPTRRAARGRRGSPERLCPRPQ